MKFQFLAGDVNWLQYGAKWTSPKLNNGEFDYWIVLELINMHDATGETDQPKYNVSLSAVSPEQAGRANTIRAFDCSGISHDETNPLAIVEALHSYGIHAPLWQDNDNNAGKLLKSARKQARCAAGLFGFYMDGPKNRIGSTGWDCIKGELFPVTAESEASK